MRAAKDNEGSIKGRRVGKKRQAVKMPKKPTLRDLFAQRLRKLAADRTTTELGKQLGVDADTVGKWLRAESLPDLDLWHKLATALGLTDYRDLLP